MTTLCNLLATLDSHSQWISVSTILLKWKNYSFCYYLSICRFSILGNKTPSDCHCGIMINEVLIKQICFVYLLCAQDSCVTASLVSGKVKSEMLHAEAEEPINIFAFSFLSSLVFIFSFVMIQHIELLYGLESLLTFSLVSISPTSVDDVSTKAASSGREALQ